MKVLYIGILKHEVDPAVELCVERDLTGFNYFTRGTVTEFTSWAAGTIAVRIKKTPNERITIHDPKISREYTFHVYGRPEGFCAMIITDVEYPERVAHALISKIIDGFVSKYPRTAYANATTLPYPELKDYIVQYQDPQNADSIMKIQKELDETKEVVRKTVESVLERGEKIETLVAKSDGLSTQSKMFYTQAKKQNSCCIVM